MARIFVSGFIGLSAYQIGRHSVSDLAQTLITLEAILGLIVIAVLVCRVVGLLVNQDSAGTKQNPAPVAPAVWKRKWSRNDD